MANSLRAKLSKLRHDRHITDNEYQTFLKKLDGHDIEIYNKAIDDFAEKIALEISESIIWDMLATMSKNGSLSDTSDKIVDYVVDTATKIAEQLKG